jgi:hypothetical protein
VNRFENGIPGEYEDAPNGRFVWAEEALAEIAKRDDQILKLVAERDAALVRAATLSDWLSRVLDVAERIMKERAR